MTNLKVSFDFDNTLSRKHIKEYAKELVDKGIEVWIVTSRFGDLEKYRDFFQTTIHVDLTNQDIFDTAEEIGIPSDRIHFMDMENKWEFLKDMDFLWHIDDDWSENRMILKKTKTKAIDSMSSSWRTKCERILKKSQTIL